MVLNFPDETQGCRPGHDHMIVIAPFDTEVAAIEGDCRLPPSQPSAHRRDQGGASTAAASLSDADAALPHPHTNAVGALDRGEFDIGPFRKQRIVLDPAA